MSIICYCIAQRGDTYGVERDIDVAKRLNMSYPYQMAAFGRFL